MVKTYSQKLSQLSPDSGQKLKRSSKISFAMKNQFLSMLLQPGVTIKSVSKHLGINYSTAKAIAKQNRYLFKERQTSHSEYQQQYLPSREKKIKIIKLSIPCCSYKTIEVEIDQDEENYIEKKQKIEIISTVSWNFLKWGLPTESHC